MASFAFIHGAGDVGWYWHLVEAELRTLGHDTVAPDLPIDDDNAGLAEYATTVVDAIRDRRDVVVVAQSFGGYIAPIVAARVDARLIVLVAAMVPSRGESADEMFANTHWEPEQLEDSSAQSVFYHDVPKELAAEALSRGREQSDTPGREPWPLAEWPRHRDPLRPLPQRQVLSGALAATPGSGTAWHRARRDRQWSLPGAEPPSELAGILDRYSTETSGLHRSA